MNAQVRTLCVDVEWMPGGDQHPISAARLVAGMEADPHSAQMLVDRDLTILWASVGHRNLLGYEPHELVGRAAHEFVHPDDLGVVLGVTQQSAHDPAAATRRQQGSGVRQTVDVRVRSVDGWTLLTVRATAHFDDPLLNGMFVTLSVPDGHRILLEAMQSVAAHAPLAESLQILLSALSRAGDQETIGAFVDEHGSVVAASRNCRISQDPTSAPWGSLARGRATWTVEVPFLSELDEAGVATGRWTLHVLSANATVHPVDAFMAKKIANLATLAIESANSRRKMFEMARVDELTGIANRRSFQESLAAIPDGDEITMLIVDLDRFKAVNDHYGHHVGDAALIEVAKAISSVVDSTDTVARLGGDEFAVLLRGERPQRGVTLERLRTRLASVPVMLAEGELCVRASIGVAEHDGGDPVKTLRRADAGLLEAKAHVRSSRRSPRGRRAVRDA